MEKRLPKPLKIALIAIGALVGLLLIVVIGLNVYVRSAFSYFYGEAREEFVQPGLNEGFVPQDLDYLDSADGWLFSGYMGDGSPSPLYRQQPDGTFVKLYVTLPDGTDYDGHGSAVTSTDDHVLLACEGGYLVLDAQEVASAPQGSRVRALDRRPLDFSPAFMNIEGDTLFAGNFYYPEAYETPAHHRIDTPDGSQNPAVLYAYPATADGAYGFADQAERVYSIPGKVQGLCFGKDGALVLSTSWGVSPSQLLAYDPAKLEQDGDFNADGRDVPLYCLDSRSLIESVEAPPMTEGIESHHGRIYIACESASNKYVFGKLIGGADVYSIEL